MYRKTKESYTWHWCKNCSKWPTSNYEEKNNKPGEGELCNECKSKQRLGQCRS